MEQSDSEVFLDVAMFLSIGGSLCCQMSPTLVILRERGYNSLKPLRNRIVLTTHHLKVTYSSSNVVHKGLPVGKSRAVFL